MRYVEERLPLISTTEKSSCLKDVTHTRDNEAHPAWSPDGEQLLFTSSRMGFKDEAIYTGAQQPTAYSA